MHVKMLTWVNKGGNLKMKNHRLRPAQTPLDAAVRVVSPLRRSLAAPPRRCSSKRSMLINHSTKNKGTPNEKILKKEKHY